VKNAIAWMKSNLVTVLSALVILASIGVLGWTFMYRGSKLVQIEGDAKKLMNEIDGFSRNSVPFPPADVDAPPEDITDITINQATLKHLGQVYGSMSREYQAIFNEALRRNQFGHDLVVPGVLPTTDASHLRHEARKRYREAFARILQGYDPDTVEPRLNADGPIDPDELQQEMSRVEVDFRPSAYGSAGGGGATPTESDRMALEGQKAERAEEMLKERAQGIHLYAETDINAPGFPFQVGPWSTAMNLPSLMQIYEGHMELWIQQDIARAIAIANRVDDQDTNVIEAPVKRLISIDVIPGYVGLHTLGGMGLSGTNKATGGGGAMGGYGGAPAGGGYGMDQAGAAGGSAVGAGGGSADSELSVDFNTGTSGRISNAIYDVRHSRMVAIVDFQQLPALFDAIGRVNFMTVLDCQVQDVDEYEALKEGYVYGKGDAVRVDMLIESIWMREWTTPLMPEEVKIYMGLAPSGEADMQETPSF
jgi:hypothetical protein